MQGLLGWGSAFIRTPKADQKSVSNNSYLKRRISWINVLELALLCYFIYGIVLSLQLDDYFMLLFFCMIGYGLAYIVYQSLELVVEKRKSRQ
jgi:hypothetical protein